MFYTPSNTEITQNQPFLSTFLSNAQSGLPTHMHWAGDTHILTFLPAHLYRQLTRKTGFVFNMQIGTITSQDFFQFPKCIKTTQRPDHQRSLQQCSTDHGVG